MIILDTSFLIDFLDVLDVLIAGIAIANGAEKVATRDGDFMELSKVAEYPLQIKGELKNCKYAESSIMLSFLTDAIHTQKFYGSSLFHVGRCG